MAFSVPYGILENVEKISRITTEPDMEDLGALSSDDIKELVKEGLEDLGVEIASIEIEAVDDSRVVLRGRAASRREKELIAQAVEDALGVDYVVNELAVSQNGSEPVVDDDEDEDEDIRDDDDDTVGTEDLARSIEDGIPYIPPTRPLFRRADRHAGGKRRECGKRAKAPGRRDR